MIPEDRYYTRGHIWVKIDEASVEIGVTEPIVRKLTPLIVVELPDQDDEMKAELPFGEIEGLNETFQLYPPVEARVTEVQDECRDAVRNAKRLAMVNDYIRDLYAKNHVEIYDDAL